ncbi:LLM class flavin-dependent oxidoreductase [Micromonospora sp. B11E3]|uniref:LLM class flavin-dependent oxidoreductase n=1 Tax=Micromonospora sp. B11E3 TaxID=3153562 RepID=UPI00325DBC90
MNRPKVGFQIPCRLPAPEIAAFAKSVEGAGFDEVWVVEDCFFAGGIAASATALAATEHITVGIGILPAVTRNAAFTAMEIATLAEMHPGRLICGLGHGMRDWMRQIGAAPASPLSALGEHLDAVRRLLAGEEVTVRGRYVRLDQVALEFPPRQPPPVIAGVRGPRSLEVAGRYADGTLLAEPVTPAYLAAARASIERGQGGNRRPHPITAYALCHLDEDAATAHDAVRPVLAAAITHPAWSAHLDPLGLAGQLAQIAALPEAERAAAVPDSWVDELAVVGTPADCVRRIRELHDAGADSVVLSAVGDLRKQLDRAAAMVGMLTDTRS